ncbi:MAG: mycothiol synthase [Nocardioidaceae bacterium]|nr:mycothiol synthase [Nocardioidaceae bacterium]
MLPSGWVAGVPDERDAARLTGLLRRHEERARGWASTAEEDVLLEVAGHARRIRDNTVVQDSDGVLRGWAGTHDRAAGRLLLRVLVDWEVEAPVADAVAGALFAWGDQVAQRVGAARGLDVQQVDSGAFAGDDRQRRWLTAAGFTKARTWWQMSRPVTADEAALDPATAEGLRIRRVRRDGTGMPDEDDLRTVHDVLEGAFADHFNSHQETFDEFVSRLRDDPGHRWDHWWVAELDGAAVAALVGSVSTGTDGSPDGCPDGSYVEYLGVLPSARGRRVAKSMLRTVIADAAASGRDRVDLEVDADSPTGAHGLYVSMGWATKYVTESWHRTLPIG